MTIRDFDGHYPAPNYRTLRRQLFALATGGALLVVIAVQLFGNMVHRVLIEDGYTRLQQELARSYLHHVDTTLGQYSARLHNLLHDPRILAAARAGDREALLAETAWRFERLQAENPHLEVMHFHDPDNVTLLRLHRPGQYGDDLSEIRPIIADANRSRQPRSGLEVGKNAMGYRAVVPITDGEAHLGILEIGISTRYFTDRLSGVFATEVAPLFVATAMQPYLEHHAEAGLQRIDDETLAFQGLSECLQRGVAQDLAASPRGFAPFACAGEDYVAHQVLELRDYLGRRVGALRAVSPSRDSVYQARLYALWGSLGLLALLLLLFFGQLRIFSKMQATIHRLAFYDPLTDLPNRSLLLDRLRQALRYSQRFDQHLALFFIDLDNFKELNDSHGHHVGDELLQQAALRLRMCVRASDTVARQGGDEFVVVLEGLGRDMKMATAQARAVAEKISETLNRPYQLQEGLEFHCSQSIGISVNPGAGMTIDKLLKQADIAMYQAKASGRNRICFYQAEVGFPGRP